MDARDTDSPPRCSLGAGLLNFNRPPPRRGRAGSPNRRHAVHRDRRAEAEPHDEEGSDGASDTDAL